MTRPRAAYSILLPLLFPILIFLGKDSYIFQEPSIPQQYDALWRKVDSLEQKGLSRSALDIVNDIHSRALRDANYPHVIKSSIYSVRLQSNFEEDAYEKAISQLEAELLTLPSPTKQVMHSVIAQAYWGYYEQNRWRFLERSAVKTNTGESLATWDLQKISDTVSAHFISSIKQSSISGATSLSEYDPILQKGDSMARHLRPTLYDFLAHRAIDFFIHQEAGLTQPAYHFEMTDPALLGPLETFLKLNLQSQDSNNFHLLALKSLQDLLRFHEVGTNDSVLLHVDLKRLQFIHANSIIIGKDSILEKNLVALREDRRNKPYQFAEVTYHLAKLWLDQSDSENPIHFDNKVKAELICEEAITAAPESYGAQLCRHLLSTIREKHLALEIEQVLLPEEPSRVLIHYRNVGLLYYRLVKMESSELWKSERGELERFQEIKSKNAVRSGSWVVPGSEDHRLHSTEAPLEGLEKGFYYLIVSADSLFNISKNGLAIAPFQVSRLSFSVLQTGTSLTVSVRDRINGKPVKDATVQEWKMSYQAQARHYRFEKGESKKTDQDGQAYFAATSTGRNFYLQVITSDDQVSSRDHQLNLYRDRVNVTKPSVRTWIFTDRSIYRPGQSIHFKGLVTEHTGENSKILPGRKSTISFYDVNGQKVSDLTLVTNEFGTFSGTFIAPTGMLNGQMRIGDESGSAYISVEEYKRPRFEVQMLPVTGNYKLGQTIEVEGKAVSYSGAMLGSAQVRYRVERNAHFPFRYYSFRSYWPTGPAMQVASGSTVTEADGSFKLSFPAIPDYSLDSALRPVFTYTVYVDVTDVSGETRSATQSVSSGYQSMQFYTNLPEVIERSEADTLKIAALNLNGQPLHADIKVTVHKLKEPDKVYRARYWEKPDTNLISEAQHRTMFPLDAYRDENDPKTWEIGDLIHTAKVIVRGDTAELILPWKTFAQGYHVLVLSSRDTFGSIVRDESRFLLVDKTEKKIAAPVPSMFTVVKGKGEPGEKASFLIGSGWENVRVLFQQVHESKIVLQEWIDLDKSQRLVEVPITEVHRGGFTVHFSFVRNNRFYSFSHQVQVPFTNKELQLSLVTFRDKMLPGSKEQWTMTVRGQAGEKVLAEVVATMYDASLETFRPHSFNLNLHNDKRQESSWQDYHTFGVRHAFLLADGWNEYEHPLFLRFDELIPIGLGGRYMLYGRAESEAVQMATDAVQFAPPAMGRTANAREKAMAGNAVDMEQQDGASEEKAQAPEMSVRTNLSESAFFFPHLQTNDSGDVLLTFTMPEALTRWKMLALAHTKDLKYGQMMQEVITQKELMVTPNLPRFFREKDTIVLTARIDNLSGSDLTAKGRFVLLNAITMQPLAEQQLTENNLTIGKDGNAIMQYRFRVPENTAAIAVRTEVRSEKHQDAEQIVIPVLSNRMLVTETLPLPMRSGETKTFRMENLIRSGSSTTIQHHALTIEFTSNPAWYAVQALPYLMEFPYECSEQEFNRYYANSIATHIVQSVPKIKAIFDAWKAVDSDAFLSNLEKNDELKQILLAETPWVRQAQNETERKKRIALLFDMNKMSGELRSSLHKLSQSQLSNGGFPWFKGMPDDRYITQYIVAGFGKLQKLGISGNEANELTARAVSYIDDRLREDYENSKKNNSLPKEISALHAHYLYARSYFSQPVSGQNKVAYDFYFDLSSKNWNQQTRYVQGMIALAQFRGGNQKVSGEILASLKENAVYHQELGMYWKEYNQGGYYWYQAPIEIQSLMIEAFSEIQKDTKTVDELRLWLLKNKQVNDWRTTKATADACYALLLNGTDLLLTEPDVKITAGSWVIDPMADQNIKTEAGTGYFKVSKRATEVKPAMGEITVQKGTGSPGWGGAYWQYFEDLDKIKSAATPLSVSKSLFLERTGDAGAELIPLTGKNQLKPGSRIIVRILLETDRPMEYVHMKDMRAAGLEPTNVISSAKYQDGLWYYESTRDASTDFFFSRLPRGKYVFEYPLVVTHEGQFSNGITQVQCMYAPEFSTHSEGIRIKTGPQ